MGKVAVMFVLLGVGFAIAPAHPIDFLRWPMVVACGVMVLVSIIGKKENI